MYKIALPQPFLRKHILNFEKGLEKFVFIKRETLKSQAAFYTDLPNYDKEIQRTKTTWICRTRRFLGVPNIRIRYEKDCDLVFTYGCLLLTNKPYCVYIENGLALYNYDLGIARNPIAKALVSFALRRENCRSLIFMSEAAQKSFTASVSYSPKTLEVIKRKSLQIYPLLENKGAAIKRYSGSIRLLFSGMFYMKGGTELVRAFKKLRTLYPNVELTLIAPLQTIRPQDVTEMRSISGLTLLDATLSSEEMDTLYKESDIFVLPTYRDSYGLVIQEALSWGMPVICTDQYALSEIVTDKYNGFVLDTHPLKDYAPGTYRLLGKYYNPKDFYDDLFTAQTEGWMDPVVTFLFSHIEKFLLHPELLQEYSSHSLELYERKFGKKVISEKIETAFLRALTPYVQEKQENK